MKTVSVCKIVHCGKSCYCIRFGADAGLNSLVRQLPGVRWTRTHTGWLVDESPENLRSIYRLFKPVALLEVAKEVREKTQNHTKPVRIVSRGAVRRELDEETRNKMLKFKYWMKQKRYSDNTIEVYLDSLKVFFGYTAKPVHKIKNSDVLHFNTAYVLKHNYSVSFQSQCVNALKLFYSIMQEKELVVEDLVRPRKPRTLPNILSVQDVNAIIRALKNVKHRCMIGLIYSAGLRRSELLNLELCDIDWKNVFRFQAKTKN